MISVILFDIDYTLLDTDKLKAFFNREICQLLAIKERKLKELNKKFFARLKAHIEFSPRRYTRFLQSKFSKEPLKTELIKLFFENSIGYRESLYPEAIPVLNQLRKKFSLGIFSEGNRELQIAKLELSGVTGCLDKKLIFIYPDKAEKAKLLVKELGKICIVDDDFNHIASLAKTKGVFPVWIKRGPQSVHAKRLNCKPIFSLKELSQKLL